jgi:hypothetical protein
MRLRLTILALAFAAANGADAQQTLPKGQTAVSVDGGPFRNYGNPWWRKDATGQ